MMEDVPLECSGLATVVVPAYNVEKYIGDCLQSLLNQTYESIEVLVVDDGSTDGTVSAVRSIAGDDCRVRLFRIENHGVSYARNYAIGRGRGQFLLFVDADDIVDLDYVKTLVEPLASGICECSAIGMGDFVDGMPKFSEVIHGSEIVYKNDDMYKSILDNTGGFLCNKGFLYCIVRDHSLKMREDIAQSEDMLFLLEYLSHCKRLVFVGGIKYCYRKRRGSATVDLKNPRWFDVLEVYRSYSQYFANNEELVFLVKKSFLPISYEGFFRYKVCGLNDPALSNALKEMRDECEECLRRCPFVFRLKMLLFRNFTAAVIMRRLRVAV